MAPSSAREFTCYLPFGPTIDHPCRRDHATKLTGHQPGKLTTLREGRNPGNWGRHASSTLPVARRIAGHLHTFDIASDMVTRTIERGRAEKLRNIVCELRDVFLTPPLSRTGDS